MAAISLSSCILSFCKPTHHIKLSNKAFPVRNKIRLNNPIMNKALTNIVEGVPRRTGNHHPNLWDNNFIQSLPQHPYEDPYYTELAEKLIGEIKDVFNALIAAQTGTPPAENISERLVMVDNIERHGIDRHFQEEISQSLDYVYRYWNECHRDLNTTALGLRILRLHRYDVSSDVLEKFKAKNGGFLCSTTQPEEEIKKILNLIRASLIVFPSENVMEEAKSFSTAYLNQALQKTEISSSLSQEIIFNLEYGWWPTLPRVEARNYIDIYGENSSWTTKMPVNKKLLYLAKLDFNIVQSMYQRELKNFSRWWMEFDLSKLTFARHRHVEYHFVSCAICVESKYSAFRKSFATFSVLGTILDDIYDTYGTIDELKLFTSVIKRWEPSPPDFLPEYMKIAYIAFYKAVNETAQDGEKTQERDMLHYTRKMWEVYIDALMQEVEWIAAGYIPTFNEYLENGKVSSAARITILPSILTLDGLLPQDILCKIDYPSRFDELSGLVLRLRGDTRTFKVEANRGEEASCITSYMRDHPQSSEEVALTYIKDFLDERMKDFTWEYLKQDNVPTCSKDHAYNISRCFCLFYKEGDGFTIAHKDIKKLVTQILINHIPIDSSI